MCACLFQMERWRLNFFFSVLMLKKIHGTLVVPSAEIYFYSVRQLCSGLNFNLYCFPGLKPVRLGFVLRYLALFSFLPCWLKWAELAFNVHAEVAAFFDVLHVENLNWLTDLWVTLCLIPCTAVLGCLFFKMPLNQTFCSFFLSLFLALSRVPVPLRQLKMKRTNVQWQSTPLTWEKLSRSWMNYGGTLLTYWAPPSGLAELCWLRDIESSLCHFYYS